MTYDGATEGDYHDSVHVNSVLREATTGNPIAGKPILFTLNGDETCEGTTNSAGSAGCNLTPNETPGTYNLVVSFPSAVIRPTGSVRRKCGSRSPVKTPACNTPATRCWPMVAARMCQRS